jgi:hypothetical protein
MVTTTAETSPVVTTVKVELPPRREHVPDAEVMMGAVAGRSVETDTVNSPAGPLTTMLPVYVPGAEGSALALTLTTNETVCPAGTVPASAEGWIQLAEGESVNGADAHELSFARSRLTLALKGIEMPRGPVRLAGGQAKGVAVGAGVGVGGSGVVVGVEEGGLVAVAAGIGVAVGGGAGVEVGNDVGVAVAPGMGVDVGNSVAVDAGGTGNAGVGNPVGGTAVGKPAGALPNGVAVGVSVGVDPGGGAFVGEEDGFCVPAVLG